MRAPDFWSKRDGPRAAWQARILAPLGLLYARAGERRLKSAVPWRAPIPVLCVGNLTLGGTGKTPVVLDLCERLARQGRKPVFLTRGYGGREKGPIHVDPARHISEDVGDEPLLLAARAPTIVARDRVAGAKYAAGLGDIIVMDDGFQNPDLAKDLSILVVDAQTGFGNGLIFPAGPLREPVEAGLKRAQAILLLGEGPVPPALCSARIPILRGRVAPAPSAAAALRGRRIAAFAGIGRPEKFFETLRQLGAGLVFATPFADHHLYRDEEIARLRARAGELKLVTTEKDFVRLRPHQRQDIETLPISIELERPGLVDALIASAARAPDPASH